MEQALTAAEAVAHIRAQTGDTSKFKTRQRGYVDWKFGEVAEYLGFTRAEQYAISVRNRFDFQANYSECLLETTYTAFLEAEKQLTTC